MARPGSRNHRAYVVVGDAGAVGLAEGVATGDEGDGLRAVTSVVVLCGGQGSRLGQAGRTRQKTMLRVGSTPLLELVLTQLCPARPGTDR